MWRKIVVYRWRLAIVLALLLLRAGGVVGVMVMRQRAQSPQAASTPTPSITRTPRPSERVRWLPDQLPPTLLPPINTRENIAQAYVSAWRQWALAHERGTTLGLDDYFSASALAQVQYAITSTSEAGWQVRQSDEMHTLQLTYASDDGTLVGFRDIDVRVQQQLRHRNGTQTQTLDMMHTFEVVMVIEEGRWRVRFLVRQ